MTVHREPTTGYTSDAKQEYREKVWKSFARRKAIHYANVYDNAFILIMPGLGTEEIDTAVDYGMDPEKIICVHESAGHVATSAKWRKKYPKTPFYCCKISEVMEKLVRDKRYLTGANLDFCNNLSPELIYEVQRFMVPGIIDSGFVLQINIMAARESKMATAMINSSAISLNIKMQRLAKSLYLKVPVNVDEDKFVSDNTPVYGEIKCKRMNALLLATSAIYIVSNPISCFVDMQGGYINNKVPMSHVSIVIGGEMLLDVRRGVKINKPKEIKVHGDNCDDRISTAKSFIESTFFTASCGLSDDSLNEGRPLRDQSLEFDANANNETLNKPPIDIVKERALRSIKNTMVVKGRLTLFSLANHCMWAESSYGENHGLSRDGVYLALESMMDEGIINYDKSANVRRAIVTMA